MRGTGNRRRTLRPARHYRRGCLHQVAGTLLNAGRCRLVIGVAAGSIRFMHAPRCRSALIVVLFTMLLVPACRQFGERRQGEVSPDDSPGGAASPGQALTWPRSSGAQPDQGAVRGDILIVDDTVLTVDELLYPLGEWIEAYHRNRSPELGPGQLAKLIRGHVQQEVGAVLLYQEAKREFAENQQDAVTAYVEAETNRRITTEFGGSVARFERHLERYGLTLEQYRGWLERGSVARHYARERFLPMVHLRRSELLAYYQKNLEQYTTPGTRELYMIEIPFASMLPKGVTWRSASPAARDLARSKAREQIAAAHNALQSRPFEDVAREFSRGPLAAHGGAWGTIGKPLKAPYDSLSARVFQFHPGQYSAPIETDTGCHIVGCGEVQPEQRTPFVDIQDEVRRQLANERINELSDRYMDRLAAKASMTSLDAFIQAAMERANDPRWPDTD